MEKCLSVNWLVVLKYISILSLVLFGLENAAVLADSPQYLDYATFRQLTSLCSEVKQPRLVSVTEAGFDLWIKGQMRIPCQGNLVVADLNGDGKTEMALLFKDQQNSHVVIAQPVGQTFVCKGCLKLSHENAISWNGNALVLGQLEAFIVWDGHQYTTGSDTLARYCHTNYYLPNVLIKLTYVGAQEEPYPGLLISSYYSYRSNSINVFKPFRHAGVSYGNDELPHLWQLTLKPERIKDLLILLERMKIAENRSPHTKGVIHSLSIIDSGSHLSPNFYEVFLTPGEVYTILQHWADGLSKDNRDAADLFKDYAKMFDPKLFS